MYPHRTIYESSKSQLSGEVRLSPRLIARIGYHLARTIGAGVVSFAVVGVIFSFWPIVKEEVTYRFGGRNKVQISDITQNIPEIDAIALGLDPYFSVYIPKIDARAKIIANVDAGNTSDYLRALKEGVAHAKGTNYPGQGKLIYLFSHSTDSPLNFARYNAVFYLLDKLEKGDRITLFFMGQEHDYLISDKFVASATDTDLLKDDGSGEKLVLQTCDPPGTSWNRLLVIARPVVK